jgi:hypothetical protein
MEDVLDPKDYILLGITLDPRTGPGPFQDYFMNVFDVLRDGPSRRSWSFPSSRAKAPHG